MSRPKIVALLSKQGTACPETVLFDFEDSPAARKLTEETFCLGESDDQPIAGTWTDVSDNEACWPKWDRWGD